MSDTLTSAEAVPDFELPNVAAGPDPFSLSAAAADPDTDAVVLLFQRDYHCGNCREQVRAIADRYDEFAALNATVVSVLPEPPDRARSWQESYDLPFALLADPGADVSDAYDQPVRFGILGSLHDLVGRMPVALVLDVRSGEPVVAYTYEGRMPADRPEVDDLLAEVRALSGD
ncbi:thioredoxin-dependent hydroperoxide peroxidase [Halorubrum coriense DSM 10284]|uniref:Thioredoxin-dependent hydroperoxide peroxidase n=1 Tax=Halorubrum coriense DSM 10284 TaxID=1227466 RepID=M0ERW2_9EURY|nr:redoxin domain-containing protein [Halorubrum coriense]ELZ49637.1 thioredoxin-dependent hydroperoxide peroxidase [Halorubrum coriense DSM 10284]